MFEKGTVLFVYTMEPGGWAKIKYNGKAAYVDAAGFKAKKILSRNEAKEIVLDTRDRSIAGARTDPEMDRVIFGVKYYFFDIYALTEGFAATACFVSSEDGKIYSWGELDALEQTS